MLTAKTILQNRYRIVGKIGQGGMGAVYEAVDERLGHTVAVKEFMASPHPYAPSATLTPQVPPAIEQVIMQALTLNRDLRGYPLKTGQSSLEARSFRLNKLLASKR